MSREHHRSIPLAFAFFLVASLGRVSGAELAPCGDERLGERADCGAVTVPEDRARPDGRTIDLRVVVLRAADPQGKAPLFVLAGGPGQAATDLAGLVLGPWAPVLEVRDVVLVDQRGTGASNRLGCPDRAAEDPASAFGQVFDPDNIHRCLEQASTHADVTLYGTREVVADLDEVRRVLGYEKVMLWGGSGGTRTALVWMREHPEDVVAAMLDGVTSTAFRSPSTFARSSQEALERVFADCAAEPACHAAFPDLATEFDELLRRFDGGPVAATVTREDGTEVAVAMSRGDFGYAVRALLYNSRRLAGLPKMIHEAWKSGDPSAFAQAYWQRDVALRPVVAVGVHLAIVCSEDVPFIDRSAVPDLTAGTFLGTYLIDQYTAACEAWRSEPAPNDFSEPTEAEIPTFLVSGYYDPSTPAPMAAEVARHLPVSRHLVVRNEAHGAEFGCAREATVEFLRTASLAAVGTACEDAGPVEFVVP